MGQVGVACAGGGGQVPFGVWRTVFLRILRNNWETLGKSTFLARWRLWRGPDPEGGPAGGSRGRLIKGSKNVVNNIVKRSKKYRKNVVRNVVKNVVNYYPGDLTAGQGSTVRSRKNIWRQVY